MCELFLFARLSREGTENYSSRHLLLGEGWGGARKNKNIKKKKKKKNLSKFKFLLWAKSVPPLLLSFLFPACQTPRAMSGVLKVAHSLLPWCLHMFFLPLGKFFLLQPLFISNLLNLLKSYPFKHPFPRRAFSDPYSQLQIRSYGVIIYPHIPYYSLRKEECKYKALIMF